MYKDLSDGLCLGVAALRSACEGTWQSTERGTLTSRVRCAFTFTDHLLTSVSLCAAQVLMSIRCRDQHGSVAEEALRRAKFKFPGRQKIIKSNNWWVAHGQRGFQHTVVVSSEAAYVRRVQCGNYKQEARSKTAVLSL